MSETDSNSPTPEEIPEENSEIQDKTQPEPAAEDPVVRESAKLLEERARELQSHIQSFGGQVQTLAQSLEARKRETTVLKIMLYTGVVVLMVAFFYSSNALHRAQLESFQSNLNHLQNITQANITAMEKNLEEDIVELRQQLAELKHERTNYYLKEQKLSEVLRTLNEAVEPLLEKTPELAGHMDALKQNASELNQAYHNQSHAGTVFEKKPGSDGLDVTVFP